MTHLLLFYRIIFYTFGFSLLGFTIYKYYKTRNPIVGSFLFLWATMTATAASYIITYYYMINFDYNRNFIGYKIQGLTITSVALALPLFVHTLFKIRSKITKSIIYSISILIVISLFIPLGDSISNLYRIRIMIFITLSNIYSFVVAFIYVLKLKKDDRKVGLIFLSTFIIFFIILYITDISSTLITSSGNFLFFPLFYMWIGCYCTYLGLNRLNLNETINHKTLDDFILEYKLTNREAEIALLLADGLTYKNISEKLFISPGTVSTHVMHIYEKTGTSSKIQLNKIISEYS